MAVEFLQSTQVGTLYNKGDIAGFNEETEKQLIGAKVAKAVNSAKAGEKKPE